jgi:hypothetical protein
MAKDKEYKVKDVKKYLIEELRKQRNNMSALISAVKETNEEVYNKQRLNSMDIKKNLRKYINSVIPLLDEKYLNKIETNKAIENLQVFIFNLVNLIPAEDQIINNNKEKK